MRHAAAPRWVYRMHTLVALGLGLAFDLYFMAAVGEIAVSVFLS
jgi:hypothetical protein